MNFIASVWVSRITGSLSIIGSSAIIHMILSCRKRKLARPNNRLMIMMSGFDVVQSIAIVVSTAAIPSALEIYGARGNQTTCVVQSIVMALGLAVPLYNSSLNLFYLLTIRYSVNSALFSSKVEPFLHLFSILGPLVSAITFAALGYAGPKIGSSTTCVYNNKIAGRIFLAVISFCLLFCVYSMVSICQSITSQENRVRRHRFGSNRSHSVSILEGKETIKQGLLYSSAFLLTFAFPTARALASFMGVDKTVILDTLTAIFYPLQGFWNFVLYSRPGVNHVRKMDTSKSLFGAIREVVFNAESVSNSFLNSRSRNRIRASRRTNSLPVFRQKSECLTAEGIPTSPTHAMVVDIGDISLEDEDGVKVDSHQHVRRPIPYIPLTNSDINPELISHVQYIRPCAEDEDGDLDSIDTPPEKINTRRRRSDFCPSEFCPQAEGSEMKVIRTSMGSPPRRVSLITLCSVLSEASLDSLCDDSIITSDTC